MNYSNPFNFHGKTEIKEIVYNQAIFSRAGQSSITLMVCYYQGHDPGNETGCTHGVAETTCFSTGTGGYSDGGSATGSGTSSGGTSSGGTSGSSGGSGSNGNNGGVYTAPVIPTYTSIHLTTLLALLPPQADWINANGQI